MIFDQLVSIFDLIIIVTLFSFSLIAYMICYGGFFSLYKKKRDLKFHGKFRYPTFRCSSMHVDFSGQDFSSQPKESNIFCEKILNPFSWLEKSCPETTTWIDEQKSCTYNYFESLKTTRIKFIEKYKKLENISKQSAPFQKGKNYFYFKKDANQKHYVLWSNDFNQNSKEILNPNLFLDDYSHIVSTNIADDGSHLSYTILEQNLEKIIYKTKFLNINDMNELQETLVTKIPPSVVWTKGNNAIFYTCLYSDKIVGDSNMTYIEKLYYHVLKDDFSKDVAINSLDTLPPNHTLNLQSTGNELIVNIQDLNGSSNNMVYIIVDSNNYNENSTNNFACVKVIDNFTTGEFEYITNVGQIYWFRTNYQASNFRVIKMNLSYLFNLNFQRDSSDFIAPNLNHCDSCGSIVSDNSNVSDSKKEPSFMSDQSVKLHDLSDFTDYIDTSSSRGGFAELKEKGSREYSARLNLAHNYLEIRGQSITQKNDTPSKILNTTTTTNNNNDSNDSNIDDNANPPSSSDGKAENLSETTNEKSEEDPYAGADVIPGLLRVSTLAACDIEEVVQENGEAILENVSVVASNVFLLKYFKNCHNEILLVEFMEKEEFISSSNLSLSHINLMNNRIVDNKSPLKIQLPGNGTIFGPYSIPSSSEFYYKYTSFDEPGIIFWGLVGRNNNGLLEVTTEVIFKSFLTKETLNTNYSNEELNFESLYQTVKSEDLSLEIPILFFCRKSNNEAMHSNRTSTKPKSSLKTHSSSKITEDQDSPTGKSQNSLTNQPRSCMIIVPGLNDSISTIEFSPSHYIFARYFNGLVCIISPPVVKSLSEIHSYVISVTEYIINQGFSTPAQIGLYGVGIGAMIVATCMNTRPELFSVAITDGGIFDLIKGNSKSSDETKNYSKDAKAFDNSNDRVLTPLLKDKLLERIKSEYGDPEQSVGTFLQYKSYSPLHNIPSQEKPDLFIEKNSPDSLISSGSNDLLRRFLLYNLKIISAILPIEIEVIHNIIDYIELHLKKSPDNNALLEENDNDEYLVNTDKINETIDLLPPFPAVLVITGDNNCLESDQSFKFIAQLQNLIGNHQLQVKPLLLYLDPTSMPSTTENEFAPAIDISINCQRKTPIGIISSPSSSSYNYTNVIDALAERESMIFSFFTKNTYCKWRNDPS